MALLITCSASNASSAHTLRDTPSELCVVLHRRELLAASTGFGKCLNTDCNQRSDLVERHGGLNGNSGKNMQKSLLTASLGGEEKVTSDVDLNPSQFAQELIHTRQTVLPKRLLEPGPTPPQLQQILVAASAAPDHGKLMPWRFVQIPGSARHRLAKVFEDALSARDPQATPAQLAQAAEKAYRAPTLILAIAKTAEANTGIDSYERMVSIGCAIQNMLLVATAMGYGSALTSGKALRSNQLRSLFSLNEGEVATCFLSIGSVSKRTPTRIRPDVNDYLTTLPDG